MSNSSEILAILEYMEKEKQISRADMIESIASAIRNAAAKGAQSGYNLKIDINPKTGALKSWALLTVTDSVADPATEIHLDKAKLYLDNPQIGDVVEREIDSPTSAESPPRTSTRALSRKSASSRRTEFSTNIKTT